MAEHPDRIWVDPDSGDIGTYPEFTLECDVEYIRKQHLVDEINAAIAGSKKSAIEFASMPEMKERFEQTARFLEIILTTMIEGEK